MMQAQIDQEIVKTKRKDKTYVDKKEKDQFDEVSIPDSSFDNSY